MAIDFDSVSSKQSTSVSADSLTHTPVQSGQNTKAILYVHRQAGSGSEPAKPTATYDGVAMTEFADQVRADPPNLWARITMFHLPTDVPPGGKIVAWTATNIIFQNIMGVIVYKRVKAIKSPAANQGLSGTASVSVTLAAREWMIGGVCYRLAVTPDGGQNSRYLISVADGSDEDGSAGSHTLQWTAASATWVAVAGILEPALGQAPRLILAFKQLMDDLRVGHVPPEQMRRRLEKVWSI